MDKIKLEKDIFPQKGQKLEPKNRVQDAVTNLTKYFKKYDWFSDIRVWISDHRYTFLIIWCNEQIDDSKLPHWRMGYELKYMWPYYKEKSIYEIYRDFIKKYGKEQWCYDVCVDDLEKSIIVFTPTKPIINKRIHPQFFRNTPIEYRCKDSNKL